VGLVKRHGQQWRIPFEDEVKDLLQQSRGRNTLDYWAGYALNPEDTARLREKAKELEGNGAAAERSGQLPRPGKDDEEPIYDLGGKRRRVDIDARRERQSDRRKRGLSR